MMQFHQKRTVSIVMVSISVAAKLEPSARPPSFIGQSSGHSSKKFR